MHALTVGDYTANFNGDFSGAVIVVNKDGQQVAEMPFFVMLALVGEKLRREKIGKLEDQINELVDADPVNIVYGKCGESW